MIWILLIVLVGLIGLAAISKRKGNDTSPKEPVRNYDLSSAIVLDQIAKDYLEVADATSSVLADVKTLPHPKNTIKQALQLIITIITRKKPDSLLLPRYLYAYSELASFRPLKSDDDIDTFNAFSHQVKSLQGSVNVTALEHNEDTLTDEQKAEIDSMMVKAALVHGYMRDIHQEKELLDRELNDCIERLQMRIWPEIRLE